MKPVGRHRRKVLVGNSALAVLVHKIPVRILRRHGQQRQFVVVQRVTCRVATRAGIVRIISLERVGTDYHHIVSAQRLDAVVEDAQCSVESGRACVVLIVRQFANSHVAFEIVCDEIDSPNGV